MAMYEKMGMPPEQLEPIRKMGFAQLISEWGPLLWVGFAVVWLGYMVYVPVTLCGNQKPHWRCRDGRAGRHSTSRRDVHAVEPRGPNDHQPQAV